MADPGPTHPLDFSELPPAVMQERAKAAFERLARRRTVRDFADRPIPGGVLENCLRAAGRAPNGANLQPWHFAVVQDADLKHRIRLAAEEEERAFYERRASNEWLEALAPLGTDANKAFLDKAGALIAIFGEKYRVLPDGSRGTNYYVKESVGIAAGFLIASLHEAGLATLTHTPSPMAFLNDLLGRPSNEKPFLLLVVGYPSEDAHVPEITKKPLEGYSSWH